MKTQRSLTTKGATTYLLVLLFLVYTVIYISKSMFSSAMASIVEAGDMTKSQTGAISAVFWIVYAILQIPGGLAADRYKPSHLIMLALVGAAIANVVIYFNQQYEVIMITWACNAAVQFGIWPGIFKIMTTEMMPSMRKTGMFWMIFGTSFGIGISMLIASFVSYWRQNFLVSTVMLTSMIVLWLISYPLLEKRMVITEPEPVKVKGVSKEAMGWKEIFKTGVWGLALAAFLRTAVDNGLKNQTPTMLMESYENMPAAISNRFGAILTLFSFFGALLLKPFQKYVTTNEAKGVSIGLTVALPLMLTTCLVGKIHYLPLLAILCIAQMMVTCIGPYSGSFSAGRFAYCGKSGTVAGFVNALASLGNVAATYGFATIADNASWRIVMLSCSILLATTILACLIVLPAWTRFTNKVDRIEGVTKR